MRLISKQRGGEAVQISYKTIATFCEHTAEMLEGVSDNAELIKRHPPAWSGCARASLSC